MNLNQEIKCLVWNPRSLNNKIETFIQYLEDNDIDIAAVSETWLASLNNYITGYLRERGYNIHHYHRDAKKGGGVSIISANTISREQTKTYKYKSFECVSVLFAGSSQRKLCFVAIYRSGDEPMSLFLKEINDFIEFLHFTYKHFILCGDFNIHCNDKLNNDVIRFYQILNSFNLEQFVQSPTHVLGNTIDLVICNPEDLSISNLSVCPDSPSDHSIIYFSIDYIPTLETPKVVACRNLHQIDKSSLINNLETGFTELQANHFNDNFEHSVSKFYQLQQDILDKHAPMTNKVLSSNNQPKWMDREFKLERADRRKKYKTWVRTQNDDDRELFIQSRKKVDQLVKEKKKKYYSSQIANCDNSQSELFKVCNTLLDKPKCSSLPKSSSPIDLANRFNNFFSDKIVKIRSKFSKEPDLTTQESSTPGSQFPASNATLDNFEPVKEEELEKIIKSAPIKTSLDDPIPATLLKSFINTFLHVFTLLVNLSLLSGSIDGLKETVVTPLLKKFGLDPENLSNYRPITGIKYLGKLIERAVLPQLLKHMTSNHLHIPNQSGYKTGYSCETLLVRLVNDLYLNLDNGKCTVLLLLDLSAAFDTVDHELLLDILKNEIGLGGTVLKWFESFLRGRKQSVSVNGSKSEYLNNLFGVPQGSVLGPILFNIYVRSLIAFLEKHGFSIHGYADDHQILKAFRIEFQFATLRYSLPKCLSLVASWMRRYFLKLNAGKSQVIVFTPESQSSGLLVQRVLLDDGSILPISTEAMNLGMLLDSCLTFTPQIDRVIQCCYKLLRDITFIRKFLSRDEIKSLVNSIVVARIDNCNALYTGLSIHNVTRLQRLQNSCARVIYGARRRDHVSGLLKELHWLPVRLRIIFKVLCLIFKCLKGTAPSYLSDILPETRENRFVRIPRTKTAYGDHAFCRYGPIYWNALPARLLTCATIDNFKAKLKHYLFSSSQDYFTSLNRYRNWI